MAQVLLENISKSFDGNIKAVDCINLNVEDKEFMVIVGPSGCGKTTTLRMIAGLEEITEGTITIADRVINDIPPKDRDIAMVFQNYALYPHMTVYQNMAFGLKLRKLSKSEIKQRVQDTAEILGLETLLDRKPKALSGGQRQRVALGRAIVRNPKAFLFDEPLSNLDAKLRVTTRAELKSLHHRLQTTSIYVTHDQAEAMTLGNRICVMYKGQIQQVAPPMEVYNKPVNRFVAGFLGTPPMNFFNGKIEMNDNNPIFILADGSGIKLSEFDGKLSSYVGQEMVLGVRPEHLSVNQIPNQSDNSFEASVDVVEPLGDRKNVYLTTENGQKFIANLDPHIDIQMNEEIEIYVNTSQIHIFKQGDTGQNIGLNTGAKL